MRRLPILLALLLALLLAACAAYQAQHAGPAGRGAGHAAPPVQAASSEFTELPVGAQCARIRGEMEAVKSRLAADGKYDCCVRPMCSECLVRYGECHCQKAARHAGPCCGECTEAWIEGRGADEGAFAWDLLERKKKSLQEKGRVEGPVWEEVEEGGPPPHEHHH